MTLRSATAADAEVLAELILSSGEKALQALFDRSDTLTVLGYLKTALTEKDGQFGYANHAVIELYGEPVAVGSCWHNSLPASFHQATLNSVKQYFQDKFLHPILETSRELSHIVKAPGDNDLCIGHLAVAEAYRRQGLGVDLMQYFVEKAKELGRKRLILDVETTNRQALAFYRKFGFEQISISQPSTAGMQMGLPAHIHLRLDL